MTYACPTWDFAADTHLMKLQRLQNKVLRTIGKFPRRTPVRELHKALYILYILVYVTNMYITCKSVYIYEQRTDNDHDKLQTRPRVRGGARNR
jgi:hypothetical protein